MGVVRCGVNEATVQNVNNRNSASREAPAVSIAILDSPIKRAEPKKEVPTKSVTERE